MLALLALAALLSGCGSHGANRPAASPAHVVVVALDFTPNPNHGPIYMAAHKRLDRRYGVQLSILNPGNGPDTVTLLLSHRAELGVLDINDLGLARERGVDVVGLGTLVREPLGAIIAQPSITRPRELDGKRVGVSGLPSDPAFLRALINYDGGHYATVKPITIGFNAIAQMAAGNIAAVPAFWSDEGVALRMRGIPVNVFRVDRYGAPSYPEAVFVALRSTLRAHRDEIVRALAAIAQGARATEQQPAAASAVIAQAAGGDMKLISAQTKAIAPALWPALTLDRTMLEEWSAFGARTGLLPHKLDIAGAFDFTVAPAALAVAKQ